MICEVFSSLPGKVVGGLGGSYCYYVCTGLGIYPVSGSSGRHAAAEGAGTSLLLWILVGLQ